MHPSLEISKSLCVCVCVCVCLKCSLVGIYNFGLNTFIFAPQCLLFQSSSKHYLSYTLSHTHPPSMLYQIAHLGDADGEPEFSSAMQLEEGETFFFAPRPLKNLVQVDELESLSPIMSCQIADLAGEDTPQLYVACGRGPRSSLRVLRHGLEVSQSHMLSLITMEVPISLPDMLGYRNGCIRVAW